MDSTVIVYIFIREIKRKKEEKMFRSLNTRREKLVNLESQENKVD